VLGYTRAIESFQNALFKPGAELQEEPEITVKEKQI